MKDKLQIPKFDPAGAIAVLIGSQPIQYPLERELALIGFSGWMLFPNDPTLVTTSQVLGAANYFTRLTDKKTSLAEIVQRNPFFSPSLFAKTLLEYSGVGRFKENWNFEAEYGIEDILDIVQFFLMCPTERKPSLLKALYFIDQGGFVSDDDEPNAGNRRGRSPSTLKSNWVRQAERGPFLWAAVASKYEFLFEISPDEASSTRKIKRFLSRPNEIIEYFGIARFCQERLFGRLDRRSQSRFRFIKFPKTLAPVEMKLPAFSTPQLDLLKTYRAPKLI